MGSQDQPSQDQPREFYGSSLRSRDFGQFVMTERRYPGGCTTPVHAHARPLFCVVLDGAYQEQHLNKTRHCTRATMLFHAAGEEHLERFGDCGARSLIVELEPAWIERVREISRTCVQSTAAQDGGILRPIGSKLYREFLTGDPASRLMIEGLLFEITAEFFRAEHQRDGFAPRWLGRAVDLIQAQFSRRLTLSDVAADAGVHPVHLAQTFRRFHHCTVGDYLRCVRIDYACEQLARTDRSFSELAAAAGFADQSHFARTFKKTVGLRPSEYRAAARNNRPRVPQS